MSDDSTILHLRTKYERAVERHARGEMTDPPVAPTTSARPIPLDDVVVDPAIQQRAAHVDRAVAAEYADALAAGAVFPPIIGFATDAQPSRIWLADGFHRVAAARLAGKTEVQVELRTGDARDALLFACGANAEHGLRRTVFDKRRAVETILRDAEWGQRSDRWIAATAKVSAPFVGKVRAELTPELATSTVNVFSRVDAPRAIQIRRGPEDNAPVGGELICAKRPATVRTGRDGRTIRTGRIGKKPRPVEAEVRRVDHEAREVITAAQAQNVAHRFGSAVSDLRKVVGKLDRSDVCQLASLAAGVLGDLMERMEGADAQQVLDSLQQKVEEAWREDVDA